MDNNNLYVFDPEDRHKLKGIGGWLILIASWNVVTPLIYLACYSNVSQMKLALILLKDNSIPDAYFTAGSLGYFFLLFFSIVIIFAFYKRLKIYLYLEIASVVLKSIFLSVLSLIMGDFNIIFTELADLLTFSLVFSIGSLFYLFNSCRVKNTFIN